MGAFFSAAVEAGDTLYVSGQLPVDENDEVPEEVAQQTDCCLINLEKVLNDHGYSMNDVVKTTVFLTDFSKFSEMNEAYVGHFSQRKPARCACEVSRLARDAKVEIDCIAVRSHEGE